MTNADLEQSVRSRIAADPRLANAGISVSADADRKEVTLSGNVPTQELRSEAVNAAKAASPGVTVVDKIDVKPQEMSRADYTEDMAREQRTKARGAGDNIGDTLDDAWIHTKLTTKLIADPDTSARRINVDVKNNVVTLRGEVSSAAAKAEAERIARDTDGVRQVVNQLRVRAGS